MDNSILLVDEETELLDALEIYLEHNGYEVIKADSGKTALDAINRFSPHIYVK